MSEPTPEGLIRLQDISKRYSTGVVALERVSLEIDSGEFVSILGPSGCGKSTILRLIAGLADTSGGELTVLGRPAEVARRSTGDLALVFQEATLMPWRTVRRNVELPLEMKGVPRAQRRQEAENALEVVGLQDKARVYPSELSGGEQQRVGIARAMVHAPELIVADEPTGNLDPATAWEIMQLFFHINASGSTVVMATHNRDIVDLARRRVVALDGGAIVRDDATGKYHEEIAASALRA